MAKGLSEILKSLKEGGRLKVIQVTKELTITHLLFIYDDFLFGNGSSILYSYMNKNHSLKVNRDLAPD